MEIQETKKYSIFKRILGNRKIYHRHLSRLIDSISKQNLLEKNPIIVNQDMEVIDGQHRLEAAKRLKVPIYFIIAEDTDKDNVSQLNNAQKQWSLADYLNFYVERGDPDYRKLQEFVNSYGIPTSRAIRLLTTDNTTVARSKFGMGTYEANNLERAEAVGDTILDYQEYIPVKTTVETTFIDAVNNLISLGDKYDHTRMMGKMEEASPFTIRRSPLPRDYIRQLEDIYNYRRQTRDRLDLYNLKDNGGTKVK